MDILVSTARPHFLSVVKSRDFFLRVLFGLQLTLAHSVVWASLELWPPVFGLMREPFPTPLVKTCSGCP